jgi:cysteine desulfurase
MPARTIYLDYAATTPVDTAVRDAMLPYLGERFGNASSVHRAGQEVRRAIDHARDVTSEALGCDSSEVYFTSGGTEADNTALIGVLLAARERGRDHLVTTAVEHHAVLDCARFAERALGFRLTVVPVGGDGIVNVEEIDAAVTDRTALVSVMHANNEIGTIQPIAPVAARVRLSGALFHTDAVQTFGQLPLVVDELGVDLLTISAHKIYGPKGAGALYVRQGTPWMPLLHGGMQEREKRAGTENAAAIVGLGKAVELLPGWREAEAARLTPLRDRFIARVCAEIDGVRLNGSATNRLANNVNLSFPGVDGETLLLALDRAGVAASSGSACASGSIEPSHVLLALGIPFEQAKSAVRFSFGRETTPSDLDSVAETLLRIVARRWV